MLLPDKLGSHQRYQNLNGRRRCLGILQKVAVYYSHRKIALTVATPRGRVTSSLHDHPAGLVQGSTFGPLLWQFAGSNMRERARRLVEGWAAEAGAEEKEKESE